MRRLLISFAVLCLFFSLSACGREAQADVNVNESPAPQTTDDTSSFRLDGEWYVASGYTDNYAVATMDEDGNFHVSARGGEEIYYTAGTMTDSTDVFDCRIVQLSDDATVFRLMEEPEDSEYLYGSLILKNDASYIRYMLDATPFLLSDGTIIPRQQGDAADYRLDGDTLYITDGSSYTKGSIQMYGNDLFLCVLDEDPEEMLGYDLGIPMYIFLRASAMK